MPSLRAKRSGAPGEDRRAPCGMRHADCAAEMVEGRVARGRAQPLDMIPFRTGAGTGGPRSANPPLYPQSPSPLRTRACGILRLRSSLSM